MLNRFRKAQDAEPFEVDHRVKQAVVIQPRSTPPQAPAPLQKAPSAQGPPVSLTAQGLGQTTFEPAEWAVDPKPGVWYLEVFKDGSATPIDRVPLDKKVIVFGRQAATCHAVLEHPSISRQHAALVHHKNGSVYLIDLGSAHGTFLSNERVAPKQPERLEVGCSLRFAASTRSYVLRRAAVVTPGKGHGSEQPPPNMPPPPDPADVEAVALYNTMLNRFNMQSLVDAGAPSDKVHDAEKSAQPPQPSAEAADSQPFKRVKRVKVSFKDEHGGALALVVGVSDGADVDRVGPFGVQEGQALVGKYAALVTSTIEPIAPKPSPGIASSQPAVTDKLKQFLTKSLAKDLYDDLPAPAH